MASTATGSQGSTVKVDIAATLTLVANVTRISFDPVPPATFDKTNLSSTAKEKGQGLADNGAISLDLHPDFADAGQNQLRTLAGSNTSTPFEIAFSDGTTMSFNGLVQTMSISAEIDGVIDGSASIEVDGAVTFA